MKKILILIVLVLFTVLYSQSTMGEFIDIDASGDIVLIGNIEGNSTAGSSPIMMVYKDSFDYQDTSAKNIIQLPAGAVIWRVSVNVTTPFNDGTEDVLAVGITGSAGVIAEDWLLSQSFSQMYLMNAYKISSQTYIIITYTGDTGDATQGEADIYIQYTLP